MLNFDTIEWTGPSGLREWLAKVVDPRHRQGIRYPSCAIYRISELKYR